VSDTTEQRARAKWDLLLADLEHRQEQMRLAHQEEHLRFRPWQVLCTGAAAGAALFAAGGAFIKLLG
jgi:hypothetical protein